jgi:anthranilate synthase component I
MTLNHSRLHDAAPAKATTSPYLLARDVFADLDTPVSAYLKIVGTEPSFLLESVEGGEQIGRYSFIGSRPRRVMRFKDGLLHDGVHDAVPCADPLQAVREIVSAYGAPEHAGRFDGGALGYLSFDAARYFERLPLPERDPLKLPDAAFMDVDTLLVFDHVRRTIRLLTHVWPETDPQTARRAAERRLDDLEERLTAGLPSGRSPLSVAGGAWVSSVERGRFEDMVRAGKHYIRSGDIFQVVLSQRFSTPLVGDAFSLYRRLRRVSPSPYMYYLDFGDHQLVGASPELLLQVEGSRITARPIAGTRRRGSSEEEDQALARELEGDEKEQAEHLMLVDLARNDIGRVAAPGSVRVERFMQTERFSHVMHLVSDVTGELRDGYTALDALKAAFPAGTVSGAPKIRAMQIIAELEGERRGPYAGAVGFVNTRGDVEMAITIRTGVVVGGTLSVQAGAGIVADSSPEAEFEETLNKARAMLAAGGGGDDPAHR